MYKKSRKIYILNIFQITVSFSISQLVFNAYNLKFYMVYRDLFYSFEIFTFSLYESNKILFKYFYFIGIHILKHVYATTHISEKKHILEFFQAITYRSRITTAEMDHIFSSRSKRHLFTHILFFIVCMYSVRCFLKNVLMQKFITFGNFYYIIFNFLLCGPCHPNYSG